MASPLHLTSLNLESDSDFFTTMTLRESDNEGPIVALTDELTRHELFGWLTAAIDGETQLLPEFPAVTLKDLREVDPTVDSVSLSVRMGALIVALGPLRAVLTVRQRVLTRNRLMSNLASRTPLVQAIPPCAQHAALNVLCIS
jgi:hypothetical protein